RGPGRGGAAGEVAGARGIGGVAAGDGDRRGGAGIAAAAEFHTAGRKRDGGAAARGADGVPSGGAAGGRVRAGPRGAGGDAHVPEPAERLAVRGGAGGERAGGGRGRGVEDVKLRERAKRDFSKKIPPIYPCGGDDMHDMNVAWASRPSTCAG